MVSGFGPRGAHGRPERRTPRSAPRGTPEVDGPLQRPRAHRAPMNHAPRTARRSTCGPMKTGPAPRPTNPLAPVGRRAPGWLRSGTGRCQRAHRAPLQRQRRLRASRWCQRSCPARSGSRSCRCTARRPGRDLRWQPAPGRAPAVGPIESPPGRRRASSGAPSPRAPWRRHRPPTPGAHRRGTDRTSVPGW